MQPEQRKLYRILKLISILKLRGGKTIPSIAEILEVTERSVYRYLSLLESVGFPLDCKPGSNRWFLVTDPDKDNEGTGFSLEEASLIRDLLVGGAHHHPLKDGILQKLYIHSELHPLAENLVNARVNYLLGKLVKAIKQEKQVILKSYHSAHSGEIKDYRIEPFDFTENYNTVLAYDLSDGLNKQFKLERIGEVLVLDKNQRHRSKHEVQKTDVFGCNGSVPVRITLELNLRSYLLLREEFPRSLPFIAESELPGKYIFHGPVNGYDGAGRFIMGLLDEIRIINPPDLHEYIINKINAGINNAENKAI